MTPAPTATRMFARLTPLATLAPLALAAAIIAPGCSTVGYSTWPPLESDTSAEAANSQPVYTAITESLRWTAERYPPIADAQIGEPSHEPFAINVPSGLRAEAYRQIILGVGPTARPLTDETDKLPTYHIARVYLRGSTATVDVIRPVVGMGRTPGGEPVYSGLTLTLQGGQQPWRVIHHKTYPVGVLDVPARNYIPKELDPHREPGTPGAIRRGSDGGGEG